MTESKSDALLAEARKVFIRSFASDVCAEAYAFTQHSRPITPFREEPDERAPYARRNPHNLDHPVVDGDGHWVEYTPVFAEKMRKVRGDHGADGSSVAAPQPDALSMTLEQRTARRRDAGILGPATDEHARPRDGDDAARCCTSGSTRSASDFAIVYPTAGLRLPRIKDDETRRAVIRAYNIVSADYFSGLEDRMTPAAIIPMHTPEEAIAELEFVTKQLGSKVGMFGSGMPPAGPARRGRTPPTSPAMPGGTTCSASTARTTTTRCGRSAASSRIAPTFHTGGQRPGRCATRRPTSSTTISAISPRPATRRQGIFLGGVTRRFPELRFAFLEGGVGWGCQLFGDLIEHWERRGAQGR